jgi:uncharacterized protein
MHTNVHEGKVRSHRKAKTLHTQYAAIEIIKKFADTLRQRGITLRHVILFGSYARNEQKKYSDIDLALVADEFETFPLTDQKFFRDLLIKKDFMLIEPHTFNTKDFEKNEHLMLDEIKKTGIEIEENKEISTVVYAQNA